MNTKSQRQRILQLLKDRGQEGAYVYEFQTPRPRGLGIAQYNARIYELRREGHNILSIIPGHFILDESSTSPKIEASNQATEPKIKPRELQSWEKKYEKYEKDGRIFYREVQG